jgi:uncharacterized protein
MLIGHIAALRRYPVKSLCGEQLDVVEVAESGIPGDRAGALFACDDHARAGKTYRGKENELLHLTADVEAAVAFAAQRGDRVELQRDEHFFDSAPVSLMIDRWLEAPSVELGFAIEWERFRPNLFVRAEPEFLQDEETFVGTELRIGSTRLRVSLANERCVVVNYDPASSAQDPRILRWIAQHRNALLGVYCDVLEPGMVRVGDAVVTA